MLGLVHSSIEFERLCYSVSLTNVSLMELLECTPVHFAQKMHGGLTHRVYGISDYSPVETPKLKKVSSILSLSPSSSDSGSVYQEAIEKPKKKKAKIKRSCSTSDISDTSLSSPSSDEATSSWIAERKKLSTNLFEVSSSDGQAETKDFNPKLLESDDGEESEEFSTNLFKVSRSDGQEMKPFNPKLLYSTSSEDPPYWERLGVDQASLNELYASITRHMNRPSPRTVPAASSCKSLIVDESIYRKEESMWNDDDDSSVDEELLNEYLERLDAEDLTKKEVEVEVDYSLSEVTPDAYHSLSRLQRLNWITTQFILIRYKPICLGRRPRPPPPLSETPTKERWIFGGNTDSEDSDDSESEYESDYEDSDQEDLKILEDSGNMM